MEQTDIPFTRPYFLSKNENPEENYIVFRTIDMTIRNTNASNYELTYFQITDKTSNATYSNIDFYSCSWASHI